MGWKVVGKVEARIERRKLESELRGARRAQVAGR